MIDLNSENFNRSLAETMAWCAAQRLTAVAEESSLVRYRRALVEKSRRLREKVYKRFKHDWKQIAGSEEWGQSRALLHEADPDSLSLLDGQLRSATLKPSFELDPFRTDAHWADAVAEVVAKRSRLLGEISRAHDNGSEGRLLLSVPSETVN